VRCANRNRHNKIGIGSECQVLQVYRVFWGPLWDHTLCAIVNDLRVYERLAALITVA
jgi:hypothetical protein